MISHRYGRAAAAAVMSVAAARALGGCCGDDLQAELLRVQGGRFGNERLVRAVYHMRNCAPDTLYPQVTGTVVSSDGSVVARGPIPLAVPIGDTCLCVTYSIPNDYTMSVPGEFTARIEVGGTVASLPLRDFDEVLAGCSAVCNGP